MSEFKAAGFSDEFGGGPDIVGLTTFTSPYYFIPPSGSTAERPQSAPPGMLRFNTDIGRLEVWRNDHWTTILGESPNLGDQNNTNSSGGTGTRGVFGGGYASGAKDHMDYITIDTLGNAQDFGDLGTEIFANSGYSGRVFGFFSGYYPVGSNIYRHTISSTGSSADSGFDLSVGRGYAKGLSNSTRGIICAGSNPSNPSGTNIIDYHSIPVGGNAQDFGNLTNATIAPITCASSVRGICAGGQATPNFYANIDYITISTTGDASDFGDLSTARAQFACGFSNATRGILGGGITAVAPSTPLNTIDFITIASTGNAQDFGDLSRTNSRDCASACSSTRGVFTGGDPNASPYPKSNEIDFLTIPTTGNSQDFGDLANAGRNAFSGCSNGHGGL
jgi:hypothetical protein